MAQAFKTAGVVTTAVDRTRAAATLAACFVGLDSDRVDTDRLARMVTELDELPGRDGYVTETFCRRARYFRPANGARIDAIRQAIEELGDHELRPALLTALLLAADRVDSTTGVQMAYLKSWAPRAERDLRLEVPKLLPGPGRAVCGDAEVLAGRLGGFDLAYLDPPYNQHRYESNYHVWETIVANDEPEVFGVACKRVDLREPDSKSAFNRRATMPDALRAVIESVDARVVVVSMSDDGWVDVDEISASLAARGGAVARVEIPQRRYVGATIGVHNPAGVRVGTAGRLHLREHVLVAGPGADVARISRATRSEAEAMGGRVVDG